MVRAFTQMCRIIGGIQGLALIGIVLLILMSIILRNFFNHGLIWVFEAAGFLMVTLVFIGVPKNLFEGNDIRVDFFTLMMPLWLRKALWILQKLIVLAISVSFAYYLVKHGERFGNLATPTLGIPHKIYYACVVIGPAVAVLVALWQLARFARGGIENDRF